MKQKGYNVIEAADGCKALELLDTNLAPIDLLLTDIVMPGGINGRELADIMRNQNPNLKVIFSSGYSADIAGKEVPLDAGQSFLQKPFTTDQVLATVRQCLDH